MTTTDTTSSAQLGALPTPRATDLIAIPANGDPRAGRRWLDFPNPVNEKAARTVAGLVVLLAVTTLLTQSVWLLAALVLGFVARVASGPRFSLFGQLATRVIAPRLGPARLVAGPPKRFAQAMGATMSSAALLAYWLGAPTLSWILVALIIVAATLESVLGYCLGCVVFGWLQRRGLIPQSVCEACNDVRPLRSVRG